METNVYAHPYADLSSKEATNRRTTISPT